MNSPALGATLWLAALEGTAKFLRSATAVLGPLDTAQPNLVYNFSWGDDPAYTAMYIEHYAKLNPLIPGLLSASERKEASDRGSPPANWMRSSHQLSNSKWWS